jgi:cytoskeletal protein CcmA (bactofilin family)
MPYIGSENIPFLTTEDTQIRSQDGETEIKGPILEMKDISKVIRLMQGLDKATGKFVFRLMDIDGNPTLSMSDIGQLMLSGKPLFEMYDDAGHLRREMGYDPETALFVDEWYNLSGNRTAYVDSNGKLIVIDGEFQGDVKSAKNAWVGNNLFIGAMDAEGKVIYFFNSGSKDAHISYSTDLLEIYNSENVRITSGGNVDIQAVSGGVDIYGDLRMNTEDVATQNWVQSQGYSTSSGVSEGTVEGMINLAMADHLSQYHNI